MRAWRRRPRWTAPLTIHGGLLVVGALSLLLLLNAVYLFLLLRDSSEALEDSVRENAVWHACQTDRQALRMIVAVDEAMMAKAPDMAALVRAYDLLYSRAELFETGNLALRFADIADLTAPARAVSRAILAEAGTIDAMPPEGLDRPALEALRARMRAIHDDTVQLVLEINAALDAARVARRAELAQIGSDLRLTVALLVAAFAGVVALLAMQLRQIATTGRELAIMGERQRVVAAQAEAASRAKSTFLATMSHEIRTPLNGSIGMAEVLSHSCLDPGQDRHLLMIRQSGYHLLEVISDVLDFSKLESGKVEFAIQRVRLPEAASTLLAIVGPRAALKGLDLAVALPALAVGTDSARLSQIPVNLTGNAVKFTTNGRIEVRGRLLDGPRLRVEVEDTGVGISESAMPSLFHEFSQVDGSAARAFGGTGLGLAICRRIVEAMGGRLGVRSRPGQGSVFWFELPVAAPVPCDPAADPAMGFDDRREAFAGRVLGVEDNAVNSAVAQGLLTWLGVEVELAGNGLEGVERVATERFDLVVMDVHMPLMSGIEATQEIRRRGDRVRIVGLTGNAFVSDRIDCLEAGMDDFLTKPVTEEKLARMLGDAGLLRRPWGVADAGPPAPVGASGAPAPQPAPQPAPPSAPVDLVDLDLIEGLVAALSSEMLGPLLDHVLAEADTLAAELGRGEAEPDPWVREGVLHGVKGAAGTLGLKRAAALADALRSGAPLTRADLQALRQAIADGVAAARDAVAGFARPLAAPDTAEPGLKRPARAAHAR